MKILVVSDEESKYIWDHFDPERFKDIELIISCGDMNAKYLSFLVTMIPAPLYYVHGNHDKGYEKNPPYGCVCIDGKLVEYKGLRILGFGGCLSPRKALHEYSEKQMWQKVNRMRLPLHFSKGFDLLVTHAPAEGLGDGTDQFHKGFESYRWLLDTYKPKAHFYGHLHVRGSMYDKKAFYHYNETTMVNACGYKIIEIDEKGIRIWKPDAEKESI